ncbi:TlpA family protein disulfide reductase [Mycolicibacterium rhodesiae]|uniref:TlpA family protein disulfide reductase n=1 Tax=Mycolicibacterium rhodesiae TaxID=36814 RepID=UPI001F3DC3A4|nr:TlpA disulfide reductase family protein [Mycolicibacterium rhodesiae]
MAVTVAGVAVNHGPNSAPAGQRLTAERAEANDPAVTEAGATPCPAPMPGAAPVPTLSGVMALCLGSAASVDVGAAVAGAPTLLNLWASWCAPCREEMPVLNAYTDTPGAVRVIGVNVRDRPSSAAALIRDLHIGYPSFTHADTVVGALGAPQLLPLSYLVDTDGSVRRLPMLVFGDVAAVTDSVAAARGERQVS